MKAREELKHFAKVLKEWREAQNLNEQEAAEILGVHVVTVKNWEREEAGLSQQDLSEKIGYHVNTINFWERGQFNPSNFALIDVCDFFDLPYDILKKTR